MNVAIILAGGTGTRIGAGIPKQFIEIEDKPILAYTIACFEKNKDIDAIEIVCHKDWIEEVGKIVEKYQFEKVKWLTLGGDSFQESTINGIFNLRDELSRDDIAVISFGVAPMTTEEEICDSIRVAKLHGNGISAARMDLLTCMTEDDESSTVTIPRDKVRGFSNPWSFRYGELCDAYEEGEKLGILDSVEPHITSLYYALGKTIWFSKSSRQDVKITYKDDLDVFEAYVLLKKKRGEEI